MAKNDEDDAKPVSDGGGLSVGSNLSTSNLPNLAEFDADSLSEHEKLEGADEGPGEIGWLPGVE